MSQPAAAPVVQVLLATWNGERFLREQINSILAQTYQPLTILARDDGSSDGTRAILEEYASRYPARFRCLPDATPTGSARFNFIRLIEAALADGEATYLACADQDDVWIPEKIALEVDAMHRLERRNAQGTPLLVFTDLHVVNDALEIQQGSFWKFQGVQPGNIHRFRRLLTQNVVTGCTTLFNLALARLTVPMDPAAFMHDWWMALLVASYGDAAFLRRQTVLYRQHAANVLGAKKLPKVTGIPKWRYHQMRRKQWEMTANQAEGLLRLHRATLPLRSRQLLEAYVRCEYHPRRLVRTSTLVRNGFFLKGIRSNFAILWYLWDMRRAKRDFPTNPV